MMIVQAVHVKSSHIAGLAGQQVVPSKEAGWSVLIMCAEAGWSELVMCPTPLIGTGAGGEAQQVLVSQN